MLLIELHKYKLLATRFPMRPLGKNNAASFPKSVDDLFSNTVFTNKKESVVYLCYK